MSVLRSKWAPGPGVPVRTGSGDTCRVQKGRGASVSTGCSVFLLPSAPQCSNVSLRRALMSFHFSQPSLIKFSVLVPCCSSPLSEARRGKGPSLPWGGLKVQPRLHLPLFPLTGSGGTTASSFFFMYQTAGSFPSCPLLESLTHSYLSSFPEVIIPSLIFKAVQTIGPCLPTP